MRELPSLPPHPVMLTVPLASLPSSLVRVCGPTVPIFIQIPTTRFLKDLFEESTVFFLLWWCTNVSLLLYLFRKQSLIGYTGA